MVGKVTLRKWKNMDRGEKKMNLAYLNIYKKPNLRLDT